MIREQVRSAMNGALMLLVGLAGIGASVWLFVNSTRPPSTSGLLAAIFGAVLFFVLLCGLKVVNPNEARVLQLFGDYGGTVKDAGPALGEPVLSPRSASRCASATSRARS